MTGSNQKIILITQRTRLEDLIRRYNTFGQAEFIISHNGGDFTDYRLEHEIYHNAVQTALSALQAFGRVQVLDRDLVPNYLFGKQDIVVALGRDGLVANVLKYLLDGQQLIGVNPDPKRWDGQLLPFLPEDLAKILPEVIRGYRNAQSITLAQATLNDGQILRAVNDLFIGRQTHASARYEISQGSTRENQSSSGVIVSTGLGATGWLKSILAGASGIARVFGIPNPIGPTHSFDRSAPELYYTVREPYPSASTGADMVFGRITARSPLQIVSSMPENGVIFSDGMEQDFLQFNSGSMVTIGIADQKGYLVV
jgi:NAD kinase